MLSARRVRAIVRVVGVPIAVAGDRAARLSRRQVGLALMYHGVGDLGGDPDRDLVPTHAERLFTEQVRFLKRHFRVVPASQLLHAVAARRRGEPFPVAITFDDDLASHVRTALPVLRRLGVPATFFVGGASLTAPFTFWWERLQMAVDRDLVPLSALPGGSVAETARTRALALRHVGEAVMGMGRLERDRFSEMLEARLGPDSPGAGLREEDLRQLVEAGFEIGFHTVRHDPLPTLSDAELTVALTEGKDRVAGLAGSEPTVIAYPHGRADERVATAARTAGYTYGFTTRPEAVGAASPPLLLGRLAPSLFSTGHFALQVARRLWRVAR